jgi:hypothetical protein
MADWIGQQAIDLHASCFDRGDELFSGHLLLQLSRGFTGTAVAILAIIILIVALGIPQVEPSTTELFVRIAGLIFEVMGLFTAVWGLGETETLSACLFRLALLWQIFCSECILGIPKAGSA